MRPFHIRVALLLIALVLFAFTVSAEDKKPGPGKTVVYLTKTGDKYHASGCRFLSKSKIASTLDEAKKKYEPCSVCKSPK
jgi:hypothetical protein